MAVPSGTLPNRMKQKVFSKFFPVGSWKTQTARFHENSTGTQKLGALPSHLDKVKARMNFKLQFLEKSPYQLPPSQPGRGKDSCGTCDKMEFQSVLILRYGSNQFTIFDADAHQVH